MYSEWVKKGYDHWATKNKKKRKNREQGGELPELETTLAKEVKDRKRKGLLRDETWVRKRAHELYDENKEDIDREDDGDGVIKN